MYTYLLYMIVLLDKTTAQSLLSVGTRL